MNYNAIDQYVANASRPGSTEALAVDAPAPLTRRFSVKRMLKRTVLCAGIVAVVFGGWLGWSAYSNLAKVTGDNNPLQLLGMFTPAHLNETDGRVNILLAGYSADDPGHQGASLTDSIMIVSYSPQTKSAVMISIPRDTWVDIPGYGYQKINAAYEDGQAEHFSQPGYASGGMGLLEEVVQQDFGIQSGYYGLIDYTAFKDAVNAVGGVTVNIKSPDPRGLYDPNTNLKLPNGEVSLNGQQALNLARARGDGRGSYGFPQGDFNRTQHQQQLLVALKNKTGSGNVLTDPVKLSKLADAIGNNFTTDLTLNDMATLYRDAKGISGSNIQSVTLNDYQGHDLLRSYVSPGGEDALIPSAGFNDFSQIQTTIQQILGTAAGS